MQQQCDKRGKGVAHFLHVTQDGLDERARSGADSPADSDDLAPLHAELGYIQREGIVASVAELSLALLAPNSQSRGNLPQTEGHKTEIAM